MAQTPEPVGTKELRITYETTYSGRQITHRHRFNIVTDSDIIIGSDFDEIPTDEISGGAWATLQDYLDDYVALLRPLFNSTNTTLVVAEVWVKQGNPNDFAWRAASSIGVAGTSAVAVVPAGEQIMTLRNDDGSLSKLYFLETVVGGDVRDPYSFANAAFNAIAAFHVQDGAISRSRSNNYMVVPLNLCGGSNEAIWRKRFRQS